MYVRDNLDAGKYENKTPYSIERVPVDDEKMTIRQAREHVEAEKQRDRDQRRLHRENEGVMNDLLRADLEIEHGVADHPKAGKLWSLAWDHGHSSGYSEVIGYYEELAELLK